MLEYCRYKCWRLLDRLIGPLTCKTYGIVWHHVKLNKTNTQIKNALFVGSTNELQKMLNRKKEDEIIEGESGQPKKDNTGDKYISLYKVYDAFARIIKWWRYAKSNRS